MSNQTTMAIAETGELVPLPKNFDKLSERKQKQLVVEAFRDHLIEFNKTMDEIESIETETKELAKYIRYSKSGIRLAELRKDIQQMKKQKNDLAAARRGMLIITKKLGFDLAGELKKMKMIEGE